MANELTPETRTQALQGLQMARNFEILPGQVIYRFYDRRRATTPQLGAHGAWWFEFEHFQSIKHFALQHGHAFSYAARLFAAILYEWSEVDGYVACRARQRVLCWKGRGRQVRADEMDQPSRDPRDLPTMTPMQGPLEVYQLFVPGLAGPASLAPQLLEVQHHGPL
jgi:hypothetical protein